MPVDDRVTHLLAQVEANGVAVAKVSDGEVFIFKLAVLEKLIADARAAGSDRASIFVKRGGKVVMN